MWWKECKTNSEVSLLTQYMAPTTVRFSSTNHDHAKLNGKIRICRSGEKFQPKKFYPNSSTTRSQTVSLFWLNADDNLILYYNHTVNWFCCNERRRKRNKMVRKKVQRTPSFSVSLWMFSFLSFLCCSVVALPRHFFWIIIIPGIEDFPPI